MYGRNRIGGVMVSIFVWSVIDRGFELRSDRQTKYSKIGSCCFSAKNAALWRNSKDRVGGHVSCGLLCQ